MISKFHKIGGISFYAACPACGPGFQNDNIALDLEYYPKFHCRLKIELVKILKTSLS